MGSRRYASGEDIITQGEAGELFYILQEGEAIVSVDGNEVARKYAGDGFGETALQSNAPRNATITAAQSCLCLQLSRTDFTKLIGDIDKLKAGGGGGPGGPGGARSRFAFVWRFSLCLSRGCLGKP
jgi:CRP-like cAMP-binding protein